jgi:hypothetical protein
MQFGAIADPPAGVPGGPTQREARAVKRAPPCRKRVGPQLPGIRANLDSTDPGQSALKGVTTSDEGGAATPTRRSCHSTDTRH